MAKATTIVEEKAQQPTYLNKRMVTALSGIVVPRWASDQASLIKIARQQQNTINPDAIFGRIDPRDTTNFNVS